MRAIRYLPDYEPKRLLGMIRRGTHCTPALLQFRFAALTAGLLWLLIAMPFATLLG
ncbi:MAG: hypothetical protein VW644_00795 [Alphaproteobacteria bacterium]|jgi:hypothetical protein